MRLDHPPQQIGFEVAYYIERYDPRSLFYRTAIQLRN